MNDASKLTITHNDLCAAVAYWMRYNVTRYPVAVSKVTASSTYDGADFTLEFAKCDEPGPQPGAAPREEGET